jgi:hypothetical protein
LKALIFGKTAKSYRSILSWRERYTLPKTTADLARAASQKAHSSPAWSADSSIFNEKSNGRQPSVDKHTSPSPPYRPYGFGKQGHKQAEREGFVISKPVHARSNSGGSAGGYSYLLRI